MAITASGTGAAAGDITFDRGISKLFVKSTGGAATINIDGFDIAIDDDQKYQEFAMSNLTFSVVSGTVDYFAVV